MHRGKDNEHAQYDKETMNIYVYVCMLVYTHTYIHTHIYRHMYIILCL